MNIFKTWWYVLDNLYIKKLKREPMRKYREALNFQNMKQGKMKVPLW